MTATGKTGFSPESIEKFSNHQLVMKMYERAVKGGLYDGSIYDYSIPKQFYAQKTLLLANPDLAKDVTPPAGLKDKLKAIIDKEDQQIQKIWQETAKMLLAMQAAANEDEEAEEVLGDVTIFENPD